MAGTVIERLACIAKAIVGTGLTYNFNIASVTRTGVGVYSVVIATPGSRVDGLVICTISGAFFINGEFTAADTIQVTILNNAGAAADPPNGTTVKLAAWQ